MRSFILICVCFFSIGFGLYGQNANILFKGKVINQRHKSIFQTHIVNKTRGVGTISDIHGFFRIMVNKGDLILFSVIGYENIIFKVPDTISGNYFANNIILVRDTLMLDETVIHSYPATYREFKEEFANLEVDDNTPNLNLPPIMLADPGLENGNFGIVVKGPITALYNAFSRKAKFHRKYLALLEKDKYVQKVEARYNKDLIRRITGFEDEQLIKTFIKFCAFDDKFILMAKEYELIAAIYECYLCFIE